jgi:p-hydroxybenzoate 3-monooxygenase
VKAVPNSAGVVRERTEVVIVGAGPAGLLLGRMLGLAGIDAVVLESRSREHIRARVRAGVVEAPTARLLTDVGAGDRLAAEGLPHEGVVLRFDGANHRIPLAELTGQSIWVYGQQEIVKDLIDLREASGDRIEYEVADVAVHDVGTDRPSVTWTDRTGARRELGCAVVAGCDGSHGVTRHAIPTARRQLFTRDYPFAWLGVLARTAPAHHELIYSHHERGFALHSMRSPEITRLYLQVPPDEDLAAWPAERVWAELHARVDGGDVHLTEGPILEQGITAMRSVVQEPLRHGRLALAGDAAHIVPPTGAKGMNLAVADVHALAPAITALLREHDERLLDAYSDTCLARVWRAEHFSWWMTSMLHRFPGADPFQHQLQLAQLRYTVSSRAAATSLAENYVGLPFP